jgi:hypothetical protein
MTFLRTSEHKCYGVGRIKTILFPSAKLPKFGISDTQNCSILFITTGARKEVILKQLKTLIHNATVQTHFVTMVTVKYT